MFKISLRGKIIRKRPQNFSNLQAKNGFVLKSRKRFQRSSILSKFLDPSLNQENPDTVPIAFIICGLIKNNQSSEELQQSLTILETAVKNRKKSLQEEIVKESNCEIFAKLITMTPHKEVREKIMSLIQLWAFMFKDSTKYCALKVNFFDF
jgi:hypothetical protein